MNVTRKLQEPARLAELRQQVEARQSVVSQAESEYRRESEAFQQASGQVSAVDARIDRHWSIRRKLPYIGMGSFMLGMPLVNIGLAFEMLPLAGLGLASLVVTMGCIVAIETMKVKKAKLDRERDAAEQVQSQARSRTDQALRQFRHLDGGLAPLRAEFEREKQAWEAAVAESQALLEPEKSAQAVGDRNGNLVVGGVQLPKR
ncbi:MAG: hypothetical protein AB1758_03565 [Candidatus Eremiobacterota bacterium]